MDKALLILFHPPRHENPAFSKKGIIRISNSFMPHWHAQYIRIFIIDIHVTILLYSQPLTTNFPYFYMALIG